MNTQVQKPYLPVFICMSCHIVFLGICSDNLHFMYSPTVTESTIAIFMNASQHNKRLGYKERFFAQPEMLKKTFHADVECITRFGKNFMAFNVLKKDESTLDNARISS